MSTLKNQEAAGRTWDNPSGSLLRKKLSALRPGSHVRITSASGQIMEGTVTENDGVDSLSLQITLLSTMRYDLIGSVDEIGQAVGLPIRPGNGTDFPDVSNPVEVMKVTFNKDDFSKSFKELGDEEKKALGQAYNKFQGYLQSHDQSKCAETVSMIWDVMQENDWDYHPGVNRLLAFVELAHGDIGEAAKSLYYAGDTRSAYCAAFHEAESRQDNTLYHLAAAFSAIYLCGGETEHAAEAANVLMQASETSGDISGIEYVLKNTVSGNVLYHLETGLREMGLNLLGNSSALLDNFRRIAALREQLPGQTVNKTITEYVPEKEEPRPDPDPPVPDPPVPDPPVPDPPRTPIPDKKEGSGKIVAFKFSEDRGTIESTDGNKYAFDLKDVADVSLRELLKKIGYNTLKPIPVTFTIATRYSRQCAVSVKPKAGSGPQQKEDLDYANQLFTQHQYKKALDIFKKHMSGSQFEFAFTQSVSCYLALSNENSEMGYLDELRAFVEKHRDQLPKTPKVLEVLNQFYMKAQDYEKAISTLNDLMDQCSTSNQNDTGKILHYLTTKARCYRIMGNYPSAISELLDWLDIYKRKKLKDRRTICVTVVYPELSELYFEIGDYENAEKYAVISEAVERREAMLSKLAARKTDSLPGTELPEEDDEPDEEESVADEVLPEPEESLQAAYEAYRDRAGFEALGTDDAAILHTALGFKPDQLYCLLTYLHCAAVLSADSAMARRDEYGDSIYAGQAIGTINNAFSLAFNSPLCRAEYMSTEILSVFEESKKYIPALTPVLFASSVLYALFHTPSEPDYTVSLLTEAVAQTDYSRFPSLTELIGDLASFRETTGFGMDSFATYKTSSAVLASIIAEAQECCTAADMRNDVFESQGQVRRMREYLFCGQDSEMRTCLNIAAANDTSRYKYVRDTMTEFFIRPNKPATAENLDIKKIDRYIDRFWDLARDVIQNEGRHIDRPRDKVKGSKRNNIIIMMKRILTCICDWLAAAEHFSDGGNPYAEGQYSRMSDRVTDELSDVIRSCDSISAGNGFDWGIESLRRAASELLSKMNGTYSGKSRKYFFIDFLRGEDILLNDSLLPETQSTFCSMPDFNILRRVVRHASTPHPALHERLSEILSNIESKHNFRSARIIRGYGEEMGLTEITGHKDLPRYAECQKQARQRFETEYQDFSDEMELCENYGRISDINGEKSAIMSLAYEWYRISRITGDYGFYRRLLDVIRGRISENASKKGEQLMRQLEELADKPEYDFGIFSKEMIASKISDQNFSSAEFIMRCILIGDVSTITDYSEEPFGYFSDFIREHATNYRVVRGAGKNITDAIAEYSGKRDMETALLYLTNNARKENKGGAGLIKNWLPKGGPARHDQLEKLLTYLGFKPVSIEPDSTVDTEAYLVLCRKQTGKVNYVHKIPAFGSRSEQEGFRVLCLYGKYDCDSLMAKFREVNTTSKNTIVLLDYALNVEERRKLARMTKQEKSFAKTFIVIDRVILFHLAKHYASSTIIRRLMAVTLPFAYYQPFVESSTKDMPPELFTGREAALTSIESPEGANLVYGGRQLGKSALLKMAKRDIDRNGDGGRAVLVEEIKDVSSAEAAKIVCDKLIIEGILDESCRCDTWVALAGHIQKRLMDDHPDTRIKYLLLMLDEADEVIKTGNETGDSPITALRNLPSDRFKLVMAGLHNLSRYNREMNHKNSNLIHLNSIVIRQFRREEATKLLTSILAYLGFRFNQSIIDSILASTYNYPGLIQFYCQKLLEAMKNDDYAGYLEISTPNYEVTESHYKKVLSDTEFTQKVNEKLDATLFTEEQGRSNYHIIALIIAYLYYTAPNEKGYTEDDLMSVAREYHLSRVTSMKPEQFSEILSEMWDLNVITMMEGHYRFATDGFRKLLGSQDKVEKEMTNYIGEGEQV